MSEELALRPAVAAFAQAMERTLRANDLKGGWEQCTIGYLLRRLGEEVAELQCAATAAHLDAIVDTRQAFRADAAARVLHEAADVANFALMIADVVRRRCGVP